MVVIKIETIGDERLVRGFNRYVEHISDFRPAFEQIEKEFLNFNKVNFEHEGTPEKFKPLSPKYKAWKEKNFPGRPILVLTGKLKKALTEKEDGYYRDVRPKRAVFALRNKIKYGYVQYYAGRKAVQLTNEIKERFSRIIQEYAYWENTKPMGFRGFQ